MFRIALIGAGAVGGYFIWGLQNCEEVELCLIAEGERKNRIEENGIVINHKCYRPKVMEPAKAGKFDVVLLATKYSGLDDAIHMLPFLIGENTIVYSLLNGVDSEEKIIAQIGEDHVAYSLMRIASRRDETGIVFDPKVTMGLYIGRDKLSEDFLEILKNSQVNFTIQEDIIKDMWMKYASNIVNNLPQAMVGADASLYIDSEHGKNIAKRLWHEVEEVAKSRGIEIGHEPVIFLNVPKTSKYSTLQDLEAKRHTEIDMFAGELMKMAKEAGIEVPYVEMTYHLIKALEEKNDGIIGC